MKKPFLNTMLLIVAGMLSSIFAIGQIMPPIQNSVFVYPSNPTPKDSVYLAYTYVSNDGCPDFILVKDTYVANQVNIKLKSIDNSQSICTEMITKFTLKMNLGLLAPTTQIYFEGTLIKTIPSPCNLDKMGIVVAGINECAGQLFIEDTSSPYMSVFPQLYAIENNGGSITTYGLQLGNKVKFGGYLIKNDSTKLNPCRIVGIATCWEAISDTSCVMNQKGIVIAFKDNSSLIKDLSSGDIYAIKNVKLTPDTKILFKGTKIQCITTPCYNIVECYKIIETPPLPCIMDKKGWVVTGIEGCAGQIFIQEYSPISSARQLYAIQGNTTSYDSTTLGKLKVGDEVKFGGYLIKNDTNKLNPCRIVGVATCWEVISDTSCVKNLKGIVIAFKDNSSIIKDLSSGDIYAIKEVKLAIDTKILFKGTKIQCFTTPCYNKVECYQVIETPPIPCVMDKLGVVVPGIDGCTGQIFIQEFTPNSSSLRLYLIKGEIINNDSTTTLGLKVGDKVRFGGYLSKNDSTMSILCYTVGVATCYQTINPENTYSLGGYALAGTDTIQSGYAVLFKKGAYKATASSMIKNGAFTFAHLPKAEYTVYVIPNISIYKKYLPTFYTNKLKFKFADYVVLDTDIDNIVVHLRQFTFPIGIGKIYGNIFFDTYSLKDSVLAKDGSVSSTIINTVATNTAIILYNTIDEPIAWTMTDIFGNYVFENIALGTYKVVCETAAAIAESVVVLTPESATVNADMVLKSQQVDTGNNDISGVVFITFPNPVTDNLTIELKEASEIDVYNLLGKLIIHKRLNSGINILNLSNISNGIYFAKIGKSTIKLVKN